MADGTSTPTGVTIERDVHSQQFVIVANRVARDKRLYRSDRGLLVEILSLPQGTRVTAETLADNGPEGRDAIRGMLRRLEGAGYVVREKGQDDRGRWWTRLIVRETPVTASPMPGGPTPEKPSSVPPAKTQEIAGRTEDGFTDVGFSGAKDLKDEELKDDKDLGDHGADSSAVADALLRMIIGEIKNSTGVDISRADAERIGAQILGKRATPPDNPVEWVRAVIRATPNPRSFLPTPTPPRYTAPPRRSTASPESVSAARAAIAHLKRPAPAGGDHLRTIAADQLTELEAAREPKDPQHEEEAA